MSFNCKQPSIVYISSKERTSGDSAKGHNYMQFPSFLPLLMEDQRNAQR